MVSSGRNERPAQHHQGDADSAATEADLAPGIADYRADLSDAGGAVLCPGIGVLAVEGSEMRLILAYIFFLVVLPTIALWGWRP